MRMTLMRAAVALVALGALVVMVAVPFFPVRPVDFGLTLDFAAGGLYRVISVAAGSVAAKAGIRPGDGLRPDPDTPENVLRFRTAHASVPVAVVVTSGARQRSVVLVDPNPPRVSVFALSLQSAIFFVYAAMALLIVRRRSDDARALSLAAFLALFAAGCAGSQLLLYASGLAWVAVGICAQSAYGLGGGFATAFAATFPRPAESGFRAFVRRATPIVSFLAVVVTVFGIAGRSLYPDSNAGRLSIDGYTACWAFFILGSVSSLVLSLRRAVGLERQQLLWIAATFAVGFSGLGSVFVWVVLFHTLSGPVQFAALTTAVIPIGLAYVILRHRVVDVGFALNRAAVFGGVSVCVVAIFVALEWLLGKFLLSVSHVASSVVELAVALTIGFSLRPIHSRIDRIVDDLFFKERHQAEQRLHRFARELPFMTEREVAFERTIEIIGECADASAVAVYEQAPGGYREALGAGRFVGDNDPAIVALKAWHEPAELDRYRSALGDGLAFGLLVRAELTGVLALGPKRGGEDYAPDEREALDGVARALASLLDTLEIVDLRGRLAAAGL